MFFNAAYWCLGELKPSVMGFIGCSMNYPNGNANTFYGSGTADPLRFSEQRLIEWFDLFGEWAEKYHCELINFGCVGLMPYPRHCFPPTASPPT